MNIKTKASRVHVFIIQIARGLSKDQDIVAFVKRFNVAKAFNFFSEMVTTG